MEIKNYELYNLFYVPPGERPPYRKLIGVKWSGSISYELAKLGKILNSYLIVIDEARVNIINTRKEAGNDPDVVNHLPPDATTEVKEKAKKDNDDFSIDFLEILDKTVKIEEIKERVKIPKDKIPDIEPDVLIAFDKFLEIV